MLDKKRVGVSGMFTPTALDTATCSDAERFRRVDRRFNVQKVHLLIDKWSGAPVTGCHLEWKRGLSVGE